MNLGEVGIADFDVVGRHPIIVVSRKVNCLLSQGRFLTRCHRTGGMVSMGHVKDEVVRLIQSLPDDCTVEEIQYHLYVRQKVEHGLAAVDEGRTVSQEQAERRVEGWLKSPGPNPR